ncbi:type IV secretory system conjugative DNA transfer family protein [Caulobacter sp. NIBR1757]|uniref:type IV secretory system conjugative DNA transfer family protein n=1 Tax=Caulobacter sp. NIBR1757 TaxID=3016000 RepID=UPI0022F01CCF|nr:type IV secretory system conjugative DNA transfer family protein [Caulobacter sp. NIBR1757]WGM37594.1 Conjugal transfer protein TraG [Caulobacter sp. NIBR1757]
MESVLLGWEFNAHDGRDGARANRSARRRGLMPAVPMPGLNRASDFIPITYDDDAHLLTAAPTGAGKGVGAIIPNLLSYPGPMIVIDPKGENFQVTARYRRQLGQEVLVLDPFGEYTPHTVENEVFQGARLNPLDLATMGAVDTGLQAQWIAEVLSSGKTGAQEPFWDLTAKGLLSALFDIELNEARHEGRAASFRNVIRLLFVEEFDYTLAVRLNEGRITPFAHASLTGYWDAPESGTRPSILATARAYLFPLLAENIQAALDNSTIDLRQVRDGAPQTIYIIIPSSKLESHAALLRLWVDVLLNAILARKTKSPMRTLALLDECANLGHLPVLKKAVTLMRGYGLQVWMFFQDISQLATLYEGEWQTMVNNCGVFQTFGNTYMLQGEALAKVVPDFEPEQILSISRDSQILAVGRKGAQVARKLNYLKDTLFSGRADPHAFHKPAPDARIDAVSDGLVVVI